MSDTIEDIRARHATTTLRADGSHAAFHAHYDRATLLAEVDRLTRERDEARAEVERLWRERDRAQAKVERARVTLREIMLISRGVCGEIESGRDSSSMGDKP